MGGGGGWAGGDLSRVRALVQAAKNAEYHEVPSPAVEGDTRSACGLALMIWPMLCAATCAVMGHCEARLHSLNCVVGGPGQDGGGLQSNAQGDQGLGFTHCEDVGWCREATLHGARQRRRAVVHRREEAGLVRRARGVVNVRRAGKGDRGGEGFVGKSYGFVGGIGRLVAWWGPGGAHSLVSVPKQTRQEDGVVAP